MHTNAQRSFRWRVSSDGGRGQFYLSREYQGWKLLRPETRLSRWQWQGRAALPDLHRPDEPEHRILQELLGIVHVLATRQAAIHRLPQQVGEEQPLYWSPTRVTNPIREAVWGGVIAAPLAAKADGGRVNLEGIFGVFAPGTLEATFYSVMGEELGHWTLQAVDSREVARLDKSVAVPAQSVRISVYVRDSTAAPFVVDDAA